MKKKNREEQIKKAAKNAATVVTGTSEIGSKYCDVIPEWQTFFELGANWADEHPILFTPEIHFGSERIEQMAQLWSNSYECIAKTLAETNHSPLFMAKMFFELGFRASDEHLFTKKESNI